MSFYDAFLGSLIADALAMPGHWYYDREALLRDYGALDGYLAPQNPHPDSILWRSSYEPLNERGDILREQARFWGQRRVHYHQFLEAGENTVNLRLAHELWSIVGSQGGYDGEKWLGRYVELMLRPGWHRDTYLEEYHRAFFMNYAGGKKLLKCGIRDEHIGGLATVPALVAALPSGEDLRATVQLHVGLTHQHEQVLRAADCLVRLLSAIKQGVALREAFKREANDWFSTGKAEKRAGRPDEEIVGRVLSPACYIDHAFPAALYLAWKYHDDFEAGIVANARVGGDSCHRGVVVGALLGAANGIPAFWSEGLKEAPLCNQYSTTVPE